MVVSGAPALKPNVSRFDEDVRRGGSYAYTAERLSSRLANGRISDEVANLYPFASKRVLDLGCGDGTYTQEFVARGASEVVGIDPAAAAVAMASDRAGQAGLATRLRFETGDIYDSDLPRRMGRFDCVVLRGVLHHLSDPERGVRCAAALADTVIILEPNGYNPVVKILESVSRYHIEHEERSFSGRRIRSWVRRAGLRVEAHRHFNLVPFFCPDWAARLCRAAEPIVERIPPLRAVGCGQYVVVASRT